MNSLKNRVQLIGNLNEHPETRITENGEKHVRFQVGITEVGQDAQGNKVTETQWHNIVAWGEVAEFVEKNLEKGAEVVLSGKLVHRTYTDKDGIKRLITEVVINEILKLSGTNSKTL